MLTLLKPPESQIRDFLRVRASKWHLDFFECTHFYTLHSDSDTLHIRTYLIHN